LSKLSISGEAKSKYQLMGSSFLYMNEVDQGDCEKAEYIGIFLTRTVTVRLQYVVGTQDPVSTAKEENGIFM
jgi:hypothetical protein